MSDVVSFRLAVLLEVAAKDGTSGAPHEDANEEHREPYGDLAETGKGQNLRWLLKQLMNLVL